MLIKTSNSYTEKFEFACSAFGAEKLKVLSPKQIFTMPIINSYSIKNDILFCFKYYKPSVFNLCGICEPTYIEFKKCLIAKLKYEFKIILKNCRKRKDYSSG
jgi:hypothetical protein